MDCCYEDCSSGLCVPPLVMPSNPERRCPDPTQCYPCLPECDNKPQSHHSHSRPQPPRYQHAPRPPPPQPCCPSFCFQPQRDSPSHQYPPSCPHHGQSSQSQHQYFPPPPSHRCCQPQHQPQHQPQSRPSQPSCCAPVRTKYVMPCYRYEDGRIESHVPSRHGTLPKSAYARNGMQDQVHGYRGAVKFLCACENDGRHLVCAEIEPIRRLYPKITMEMRAVKKKKDRK